MKTVVDRLGKRMVQSITPRSPLIKKLIGLPKLLREFNSPGIYLASRTGQLKGRQSAVIQRINDFLRNIWDRQLAQIFADLAQRCAAQNDIPTDPIPARVNLKYKWRVACSAAE